MVARLDSDFYAQDTIEVARALLGKILVHRLPSGRKLSGRIVETEAYLGVDDPAAHSHGGRRTARTEVMYGPPGTSYIYFVYGMHYCFNVVTMPRNNPQAVLVRALDETPFAANGPAKLCQALLFNKAQNGLDLTSSRELWIEDDGARLNLDIVDGPRVGVAYSGDAAAWPLRFGFKSHPSLSPHRFPNYLE